LPEDSGLGSILRALLGYADSPHLIEVVAYLAYFVVVWVVSKTNIIRPAVRATPEVTRTA
jgi:high-affinity Fe2+/Pb2+ permease